MGSVPHCQKEIPNHHAIRWFKCKLKPPKKSKCRKDVKKMSNCQKRCQDVKCQKVKIWTMEKVHKK